MLVWNPVYLSFNIMVFMASFSFFTQGRLQDFYISKLMSVWCRQNTKEHSCDLELTRMVSSAWSLDQGSLCKELLDFHRVCTASWWALPKTALILGDGCCSRRKQKAALQTLSLLAALHGLFSFKCVLPQHLSKVFWCNRKLRSQKNS